MYFVSVVGASAGDRGAVAARRVPQPDAGPQPPGHVAERALRRGRVSGRVAPAPQQGVAGRQQAGKCRAAQGILYSNTSNLYPTYVNYLMIAQH